MKAEDDRLLVSQDEMRRKGEYFEELLNAEEERQPEIGASGRDTRVMY